MRKASSLIIPVFAATLIGCAEEPKPPHESPETVFAAYQRALEKRDWNTLFELLSSGEKEQRIFNLLLATEADKDGKITKIIEKYYDARKAEELGKSMNLDKATSNERVRWFSSSVTDKKRLFVEVNLRLDELGTERPTLSALRQVVRRGRKAKGLATSTTIVEFEEAKTGRRIVRRERRRHEMEVPVYFIKLGTKWFLATRKEWEGAE